MSFLRNMKGSSAVPLEEGRKKHGVVSTRRVGQNVLPYSILVGRDRIIIAYPALLP